MQTVCHIIILVVLLVHCKGYRLARKAQPKLDERYECLWHTKRTDRVINSKHYEDEQNYTIEDCRGGHTITASVRCSRGYLMHEKCYCGHNSLREVYCDNVRAKFDCTQCSRHYGCLNEGEHSNENRECVANENKLLCQCKIPTVYGQYHAGESPFHGSRCEKVYEHRRCQEEDTLPNVSIKSCDMATQYDTRCKLTVNKTILLCGEPLKDITEVKEPQHCRDIVSERESENDDDDEGEDKSITIEHGLKVPDVTPIGNVSFYKGNLQLHVRLFCRSDVPIAEMEESTIENDCFVNKVNIRYCDRNGKCGKRLRGIRKLFDTLK